MTWHRLGLLAVPTSCHLRVRGQFATAINADLGRTDTRLVAPACKSLASSGIAEKERP